MNTQRGSVLASVVVIITLVLAGAGLTLGVNYFDLHLKKTPIYPENNRQVAAIPSVTQHWERVGSDSIASSEIVETLGTENYVSRNYMLKSSKDDKNPVVVQLHAAYYTGGIDTVPHVPERCFVGGGLQQGASSRVLELELDTTNWRPDPSVEPEFAGESGLIYTTRLSNNRDWSDAPGTRVRLPRDIGPEEPFTMRCSEYLAPGGRKVYAGYFFIANGGVRANANDVRTLAFNLTDDYAFYLKVQVTSYTADSFEEHIEHSSSLLSDIIGEIMRCTPDWVEVRAGRYPEDSGEES